MPSFDRRHPVLFAALAIVLIAPAPWMLFVPLLGVWGAGVAALAVASLLLVPLWLRMRRLPDQAPCWSCGREVPLVRLWGFCIACGAYPKGRRSDRGPHPV